MSDINFSRGAVAVPRTGSGGPDTSKRKMFDNASPLILVPEETSIIKQSDGYKFSAVFYSRLSANHTDKIGMNGPIKIQHSWFKDSRDEKVYRPNLFIEFTYSEKNQESFYWAYNYDEFKIPLNSFEEEPKTVVIYVKDLDPTTSRGTETTVQGG
jgi:hypothetical protein